MKFRLNLPAGRKFGTVLADPPWLYRNGGIMRRIPYDTMTTEEVAAIPVASVCKLYAHLWLWTTNPHLPEALRVMAAWGFTYKGMKTWCKPRMGLGWWMRSKTEHMLFGILCDKRGQPGPRVPPGRWTTVDHWPQGKHSEKPRESYRMIEELSPGPRLELFARTPRRGWTTLESDAPASGDPFGTGYRKEVGNG